MKIRLDIQLNKAQQDFMDLVNSEAKYILINASRQIGKSVFNKLMCFRWLFENNRSIGFCTPTLKLSKKFFKDLKKIIPSKLLVTCNATDLIMESITGSTLYFCSSEQSDKIRGNTFDYLILDECAFFNEGDEQNNIWYSVLYPTIKVKGKKIIMVSTPRGKRGFWYELIQKAEQNGYAYIMRDIYFDSTADVELIKSETPRVSFLQEFLCQFLEDSNSYFSDFQKCSVETLNWKEGKVWAGIDFSSVGTDETIMTIINEYGQIIQFKIEGDLDTKYSELAKIINSYKLSGIYAEKNSIGEVMINQLKKLTKQHISKWNTSNESKTEIIQELAIALERGQINYSDEELHKQLSAFGYKYSPTGKMQFAGVGEKDDRVISLALALRAKKDLKGYNKSNFVFV